MNDELIDKIEDEVVKHFMVTNAPFERVNAPPSFHGQIHLN